MSDKMFDMHDLTYNIVSAWAIVRWMIESKTLAETCMKVHKYIQKIWPRLLYLFKNSVLAHASLSMRGMQALSLLIINN